MAVGYKKLWKLLAEKGVKKKDLCTKAGTSSALVTKMGKYGRVTTEILLKIYAVRIAGQKTFSSLYQMTNDSLMPIK